MWLVKKCILVLLVFTFTKTVSAQTFIITYKIPGYDPTIKQPMPFTLNRDSIYYYPPNMEIKLLCNDSIGFSALCDNNKTLIKMFEKAGKKRISNHIQFSVIKDDRVFKVSYWPTVKKDFFVLDTLWTEHWVDDTASYSLFNYSCKMAHAVSAGGDTSFVYYTNALPGSFGPLTMWGRAGTMVGTYQQRWGRAYVATSIEKVDYEMKLPSDKIILTRKEYELLGK